MHRDFDQEFVAEDLSFTIGGETFKMSYARPEVLAAWEDEDIPDKSVDALALNDARIKQFLDSSNGAGERWDALRAREENPVTMGQINALLMWMVEVQAGRPTIPPSPSDSGPGKTKPSSKVA